MSGPMDPVKLARFRSANNDGGCAYWTPEVTALLEAHDHHSKRADAAEAKLENAITEAAGRLLDDGEPVGLRALVLDRAAKWIAIGGGTEDRRNFKRLAMYSALGRELLALARTDGKPQPSGLRGLLDDAERERDRAHAKLRVTLADDFDAWQKEDPEFNF